MIILKEAFDLKPIRDFMKKHGFVEEEGYLTFNGEHVGSLMFRYKNIQAIYNYPGNTLSFQNKNEVSIFTCYVKNIRRLEIHSNEVLIETFDESKFNLYV